MLTYIFNFKFWGIFFLIIFIIGFCDNLSKNTVKSDEETLTAILNMLRNFEELKIIYNTCIYQNCISKRNTQVESEICFNEKEFANEKKILFNELKKIGFVDAINLWPKEKFKTIFKTNEDEFYFTKKEIETIKKLFCSLKVFFNQHKKEILIKRNNTAINKQINKQINNFIISSIKPTSDLLISILDFLKNVNDDTFEYEREFICDSTSTFVYKEISNLKIKNDII